jgi:hypothetical protein
MMNTQIRFLIWMLLMTTASDRLGLPAFADEATSPLVQRNVIRLQEAGAQVVIDAAIAKAKEMKLNVSVTVLDQAVTKE